MTSHNRVVGTEEDRNIAAQYVASRDLPFTLTLTSGKHRTTAQNKLQRLWMNEIAEQKGDMTPEYVRGYCKLTIGVPILRAENEAFREKYDAVVKPLSYEQKIAIMMEPLNMPVTSIMNTAQKTAYLDGIIRHFGEQGIVLTMPEDRATRNTNTGDTSPPVDGEPTSSPVQSSEPAGNPPSPAGSHISKEDLIFICEFVRKALDFATEDKMEALRQDDVERMVPGYMAGLDDPSAREALKALSIPISAVLSRKRTREEAESYIARQLGCAVEDLRVRK
jgi:hypothetical protein